MAEDERAQRLAQRTADTLHKMAASQATLVIGEIAVALHQQGQELTAHALVTALLAPVQTLKPGHLQRVQHEEAARLLGWNPGPEGG